MLTAIETSLIFSLPRTSARTLKGCDVTDIKTCIEGSLSPQFLWREMPEVTFIKNGSKVVAQYCQGSVASVPRRTKQLRGGSE